MIAMLAGAMLAGVFYLLGVLSGARGVVRKLRGQGSAPRQPQPICVCEHGKGAHEDGSGECLAEVEREHYHSSGSRNGWEWVDCACTRYYGPEPIAELFSTQHYLPEQQ